MALNPGSRVRIGFEFDWSPDLGYDPSTNEAQLVSIIRANLLNFLDDGVTFSNVSVVVDPLPGWVSSGYITVEATTNTQLPNAEAFGDMVQYAIEQYLLIIKWTRRDSARIDYAAPAPTPKVRPRPDAPAPDQTGWLPAVEPLPRSFYETPSPPKPPPQKGASPWLWLGLAAIAVIAISRD